VVNIRYKPARAPQILSSLTRCTNSAHPYQNKGFITSLFSHVCAHLRLQALCFKTLHKNTRGDGVTLSPTVPSRIGMVWPGQAGGEVPPLRGPTRQNSAQKRKFRRWPTYSENAPSQPERGVPCDILASF